MKLRMKGASGIIALHAHLTDSKIVVLIFIDGVIPAAQLIVSHKKLITFCRKVEGFSQKLCTFTLR